MLKKIKYCFLKLFVILINKALFKLRKLLQIRLKYIISILLVLCLIKYLSTRFRTYHLLAIGKYDVNIDALEYQNKTLKSLASFKILCNFSQKRQFYFNKSKDLNILVNETVLNFCYANLKEKYQAKIADESFVLNKTKLDKSDLDKLEINNVSNGFYQPPLCIQNYLIKSNNLIALRSINARIESEDTKNLKSYIQKIQFKSEVIESLKEDLTIVVIPFLNRENDLKDLLLNLHGFLQRQFIQYRIIVSEQINTRDPFNKGRIYNAAFKLVYDLVSGNVKLKSSFYSKINPEVLELFDHRRHKLKCLIFHDVDLIPESDFNVYKCGYLPRHLSLMIRKEKEYMKSPYEFLIGGVLLMRPEIFTEINGFSNEYWSWGAEDDDLAMRLIAKNYCVKRPSETYALYKMSKHVPSKRNIVRNNLLFNSIGRMPFDGLSNLESLDVKLIDIKFYSLFTHLKIDVSSRSFGYFFKYSF